MEVFGGVAGTVALEQFSRVIGESGLVTNDWTVPKLKIRPPAVWSSGCRQWRRPLLERREKWRTPSC